MMRTINQTCPINRETENCYHLIDRVNEKMYTFFNSKFAKGLLMCSPLLFIHIHKYYPNTDPTRVEKTEKHSFNSPDNVVTEVLTALEGLIIFSL